MWTNTVIELWVNLYQLWCSVINLCTQLSSFEMTLYSWISCNSNLNLLYCIVFWINGWPCALFTIERILDTMINKLLSLFDMILNKLQHFQMLMSCFRKLWFEISLNYWTLLPALTLLSNRAVLLSRCCSSECECALEVHRFLQIKLYFSYNTSRVNKQSSYLFHSVFPSHIHDKWKHLQHVDNQHLENMWL